MYVCVCVCVCVCIMFIPSRADEFVSQCSTSKDEVVAAAKDLVSSVQDPTLEGTQVCGEVGVGRCVCGEVGVWGGGCVEVCGVWEVELVE